MKILRYVAVVIGACSIGIEAQQKNALQQLIDGATARVPARVGLYVKHLGTNAEASIRGDEIFNSQSTRKIPIMMLAFEWADAGKLNLDERVTLRRSDVRTGTGVLQYHDPGMTMTVRDLITEMIITSDNTATNLVMAKLGGPDRINQISAQRGYVTRQTWGTVEGTRRMFTLLGGPFTKLTDEEVVGLELFRTGSPMFDRYTDVFDGSKGELLNGVKANASKLAESIRNRRPEDEDYWTGRTSPHEIGTFLESIERGTAVSAKRSLEMKNILLRQQLGTRRIPHYLTVPVAHKTGDGSNVANDVAIVYARSGPIVISFFTMGITGSYAEAEDQMGRISQQIVEYFDRQ